jgi:hypothetical protein
MLKMSGAILLLPRYAFMARTGKTIQVAKTVIFKASTI